MRRVLLGAALGALAYPLGVIVGHLLHHRSMLSTKG